MKRMTKVLAPLIAISLILPISAVAQITEDSVRARVGFASTVEDSELISLLQQHNVSANAVYMWSFGLSGTHRTYEKAPAEAFLRNARAKVIDFLNHAIEGNTFRLKRFLDSHSSVEVESKAGLQRRARSMLGIRGQMEDALMAALTGLPLFYGIEVEGLPKVVSQLQTDSNVRSFVVVQEGADGSHASAEVGLKPSAYHAEYRDPIAATASPRRLYSMIEDAVASSSKEIQ